MPPTATFVQESDHDEITEKKRQQQQRRGDDDDDDDDSDGYSNERVGLVSREMPREEIAAREPVNHERKMERGKERKQTVLEAHCAFFDVDNDGVLWPHETFRTCRSFSWSIPLSLFFTGFLHIVQSWGTVPWWHGLPDPLFRIWVHNVHFNKHGSSTMAFDNEGTFRPDILDEFFAKFDEDGKDGLTFWEGFRGLRRIRMVWDCFGQVSAFFEWGFTYVLLWPEDGVVRRKDAHRVLDGSIFHEKVTQKRKREKVNGKANGVKSI